MVILNPLQCCQIAFLALYCAQLNISVDASCSATSLYLQECKLACLPLFNEDLVMLRNFLGRLRPPNASDAWSFCIACVMRSHVVVLSCRRAHRHSNSRQVTAFNFSASRSQTKISPTSGFQLSTLEDEPAGTAGIRSCFVGVGRSEVPKSPVGSGPPRAVAQPQKASGWGGISRSPEALVCPAELPHVTPGVVSWHKRFSVIHCES